MAGLTVPRTGPTSLKKRAAPQQGYSPTLASKLLGINYNTILYWVRTKLVRASVRYESRQWTPVLFSFDDLLELKFIQSLREKGAPTRRIRKALNFLRKELKHLPLADIYLDVTTDDIHVVASNDQILSAVKNQGQLLLINISRLKTEIEEKARKSNIKIAV
jgi:DNA-binding transcriptional MerR regulator